MQPTLKKTLTGFVVRYQCQCGESLTNKIKEVGMTDYCPVCGRQFVVPGASLVAALKAKQDAAKKAKEHDPDQSLMPMLNAGVAQPPTTTRQLSHDDEELEILDWLDEDTPQSKQCPFCAETIQYDAMKCRYCGEFMDGRQSVLPPTQYAQPYPPQQLKDPGVAAVLSLVIPGLGQVYSGRIISGIVGLITCAFLYYTIILGVMLHILLIFDAYSYVNRLNHDEQPKPKQD